MSLTAAPSLYIPHGGGPLPLLDHPLDRDIRHHLQGDVHKILLLDSAVKAIIVVTAHWESTDVVRVSSAKHHDLMYDYNFRQYPEAYTYKYNAPGHPELAARISDSLNRTGVPSALDDRREWDHGTFVPMMLINPDADIPIVQVSILKNQDTEAHWKIGEALKPFREEGVAILGSGMSFHNMYLFRHPPNGSEVINHPFDAFLDAVCDADEEERKDLLMSWRDREGALESHPLGKADHFMPFIVNAGAAGFSKCKRVFDIIYEKHFRLGSYNWF